MQRRAMMPTPVMPPEIRRCRHAAMLKMMSCRYYAILICALLTRQDQPLPLNGVARQAMKNRRRRTVKEP